MKKKTHHLKTESQYFHSVGLGIKRFELRKNDRYFQVGDDLVLIEVANGVPTGQTISAIEVKYILHGGQYGPAEGYCILGF